MKISVWKDRPGRTRVMVLLGDGKHEEARRYYYKQYYPDEDIKRLRILQLDMNPFNFEKENLIAITPQVMNCLLNNHLLSNNPELNKLAIETIKLELMNRSKQKGLEKIYGKSKRKI